MLKAILLLSIFTSLPCVGQAALPPSALRTPSLEEIRRGMGIPSSGDVRGQQDAVGFASKAPQMAKVWELSALPPDPESFGNEVRPGIVGAICPHDDYIFAGRVYRRILPLVTARTVVLVGVFHKYRRFAMKDVLVFDPYRSWRSPDGEINISRLRQELLAKLPAGDFIQDAGMHDSEHSVEAIAYWLKHARPDVEILPILVPAMSLPRMEDLASRLAAALAVSMKQRNWVFGKDLAIVISSDGVHYGSDFKNMPYGEGGVDAYVKACAQEKVILERILSGPVSSAMAQAFLETCVNPAKPDEYRLTWCGRFSVPFGLLLMNETAKALGQVQIQGRAIAFGTSIGFPELPLKDQGLGATAPANLYHFVGYPGVAYTVGLSPRASLSTHGGP